MLPILVEFLAKVGLLLLAITGSVPLVLWLERKGAAWMQDRTGPDSAAILGIGLAGMAHSVADMVKLQEMQHKWKEDFAKFFIKNYDGDYYSQYEADKDFTSRYGEYPTRYGTYSEQ